MEHTVAKHDAEYFRLRRRQQGVPIREDAYLYSKASVERGRELRMMERLTALEWPSDLFSAATAPAPTGTLKNGDACTCGKPHRQNFPRTKRSPYGQGFDITYYCSDTCKSRSVREGAK